MFNLKDIQGLQKVIKICIESTYKYKIDLKITLKTAIAQEKTNN